MNNSKTKTSVIRPVLQQPKTSKSNLKEKVAEKHNNYRKNIQNKLPIKAINKMFKRRRARNKKKANNVKQQETNNTQFYAKLPEKNKNCELVIGDCIVISSDSEVENNALESRIKVSNQHSSSQPHGSQCHLNHRGQPNHQNRKRKNTQPLSDCAKKQRVTANKLQPSLEPSPTLQRTIHNPTTFNPDKERRLSHEISKFLQYYEQKPALLRNKFDLQQALENAIKYAIYPNASVHLVGSSINGFGRHNSDADMCVVLDTTKQSLTKKQVRSALYGIERLLRNAPFVKHLEVIHAKVPIIKFVDNISGMECDININNLTGIRNTFLLFAYARYDPRVRPLVLCVKAWAKHRNINNAKYKTLSSYTLVLMVMHYLQCGTHPVVLPSLQEIHPDMFCSKNPVFAIETEARRVPIRVSQNQQSLCELLRGFFHYFSTFDYDGLIMSVRTGKAFSIDAVSQSEYWKPLTFKIEEPFDQSNVARAVSDRFKGIKIIEEFRKAATITKTFNHLNALIPEAPLT